MQSKTLFTGDGFVGWQALNDTVMGGNSQGNCHCGSWGLEFTAFVVARGGGFVSCRSPEFNPPLNLGGYAGLRLRMAADGRRFKLAVACNTWAGRAADLIPGGLRWVAEFPTKAGPSTIVVPFAALRPVVRAKPLTLPLRFDPERISRLQILHSRFDGEGGENQDFRAGPLRFTITAIEALANGVDSDNG